MKNIDYLKENNVNINKSLELFGDIETYNSTLFEFLKDINKRLENLQNYKEIADMTNYSILVHSLKSDMRYFGFDDLGEKLYNHELESKKNNIYFVYENYNTLIREIKKMVNIASQYLGDLTFEMLADDEIEILDKETILVVDDSDIIQSFIKKIFEDKYNILIAKDGEEALTLIDSNYNIIAMLLDLEMPNVNGLMVLKSFKEKNLFEKIPVSIITGVGDDEVVNQTLDYPIIAILRKPFNERDVKEVLNKMI